MTYAQHLDGSNAWTGLVLVVCSLLLGMFMVTSGWAVLKVSIMRARSFSVGSIH